MHALQWVAELRLDDMDFSLDSKAVMDAFNDVENNSTDFGNIIILCRQLFTNYFHDSKVKFSRRQVNRVAHELAQATRLETSSQLFDDVLPYIYDLFCNKMH